MTLRATIPILLVLALGPVTAARAAPIRDPATAQLLFADARRAHAQGRREAVIQRCTAALRADPRHLAARHLRGVTYAALGKWRLAEKDLSRLRWKRPRDVPLLRLLAKTLVKQRKWMWAARTYQQLLRITPKAGDLWLAFGYALVQLGDKNEARKALTRARTLGPRAVANPARVLLAVLLQQQGKLREARHLVGGLRGPGQAEAARLTRLIYAAEGRADRGLTLTFKLGTGFDSNVSMDPADSRGSGSRGWMQQLGAGMTWRAFTLGRHAFGLTAAAHRTFAVNWWDDDSCVPDYSTLVGAISPYWAVRFATGRRDHEIRIAYRGQVVTLDGDCTEDSAFHAFSESHGGAASWELSWNDRTATHMLVDLGYTLYRQQVRDQLGVIFEVGQSVFLAGRRVKLYPALHLRYEHARGDWWSAVAVRPSLALSALLPGKIDLLAAVGGELLHHPDSAEYRPWQADGDRTDWIFRLQMSVGRAFTPWLRGDLTYRFRLNHSNARVWDYQRHEVGFALTARVELLKPGPRRAAGGGK